LRRNWISSWIDCKASCRRTFYQLQPVRQVEIPKAGKPDELPTVSLRFTTVCQQALLNRLEPIFGLVLDEANFGYRRGRSTKDAMRKEWKEIPSGRDWIVTRI
jgi:retron-type reverse transcriptase